MSGKKDGHEKSLLLWAGKESFIVGGKRVFYCGREKSWAAKRVFIIMGGKRVGREKSLLLWAGKDFIIVGGKKVFYCGREKNVYYCGQEKSVYYCGREKSVLSWATKESFITGRKRSDGKNSGVKGVAAKKSCRLKDIGLLIGHWNLSKIQNSNMVLFKCRLGKCTDILQKYNSI